MTAPPSGSDGFPRSYGKYELLGRLGDGGMAEVFLARLPGVAGFRKTVVIKRILPHLARKKRFVEMFVAEASLAAEVRHRNVVQVYELGRVGEELFMAMEYVEGTDLRVLLGQAAKRGLRIPPWFSVHLISEVLEALTYAWELADEEGRPRRIVHRDVTPSNIFVSSQGEVKLGDFGVARDDTRESRTRAGQLKGKLAYMAPEQLYSKPPDHRVDVFAAGVCLWEALAQRRLFGGKPEIEVMNAITQSARRAPSEHVGDIPPKLDAIVLAALEIDKRSRLASAQEFQEHLLDVLPGLRASVRASDVRSVVADLLGRSSPEARRLGPLAEARSTAGGPRSSTQASFGGSGEHSESPVDAPLADPFYDDEDAPSADRAQAPPDLVGDLELDPEPGPSGASSFAVLRGVATAPPTSGPPRARGGDGEATADRPRPTSATGFPVLPGRPLEGEEARAHAGSGPRVVSGRPASPPPEGSVVRAGVLSASSSGTFEVPELDSLDPASPRPPPSPTQDDLDMEALVSDAVASVEATRPESSVVPKDNLLAGLEHRRLLDNSRRLKSERWSFILDQEVYEGEHPFWVRDHEGTEVGPCSFEQALQIVKVEMHSDLGDSAFISHHRGDWLSMQAFLQLAGMETLAEERPPGPVARPSWSGSSEEHSIASVLAALTRAQANGRLIVEGERSGSEGFRVLEVARGRPTYVWAAGEALQIPQLLVSKRIVHPRLLPPILQEVLRGRTPLARVLATAAGIDVRRYFPMLMKERLAALFSEGYARFAFDSGHTPKNGEPFAKTLLAPVSELTFRVTPTDHIESKLLHFLDRPLEPARDFAEMVDALGFKPEHVQIADRLARGRRINKILDASPSAQARVIRTIAYILLETELLRPA